MPAEFAQGSARGLQVAVTWRWGVVLHMFETKSKEHAGARQSLGPHDRAIAMIKRADVTADLLRDPALAAACAEADTEQAVIEAMVHARG